MSFVQKIFFRALSMNVFFVSQTQISINSFSCALNDFLFRSILCIVFLMFFFPIFLPLFTFLDIQTPTPSDNDLKIGKKMGKQYKITRKRKSCNGHEKLHEARKKVNFVPLT